MKTYLIILLLFTNELLAQITKVDNRNADKSKQTATSLPTNQNRTIRTMPNSAFVFNPNIGKYTKQNTATPAVRAVKPFVIFNKEYKWELGKDENYGNMGRITVRDLDLLKNSKKSFLYKVNINDLQGYPYFKENGKQLSGPAKPFIANNLIENQSKIGAEMVNNDGLKGIEGKTNVFYYKKVKLGALALTNSADYLIVTDTLYLSQPGPLNNTILCVQAEKRPFLKLIANTIIYEGPIQTAIMGESDIVLASNNVFLASKFDNLVLEGFLKKSPPIMRNIDNTNKNHHYFNTLNQDDKLLLNRLNVKLMKAIIDVDMNMAANSWAKDKHVDKFQTLRMRTYREALAIEPGIQRQFANACDEFDKKYGSYKVEPLRSIANNINILAKRNPDLLPTIKYYALPTIAQVKAMQNDTTSLIGTIKFNPTGNVKLVASVQVKLTHSSQTDEIIQKELSKYGISLEKNLPQDIFTINKQPLKIMGKTMGEIIPISNSQLLFEIELLEDTKTLLEIFPKGNVISIPVEFKIAQTGQTIVNNLPFVMSNSLSKKLDFNYIMKSFDVFEKNTAIKEVKLTSNLFASQANEGPLDYVEVALEINSDGKSVFRGPFSLSSYNTEAANMVVPFLATGATFTITVSGRAIYENGTKDIIPFTTASEIVTIDEQVFKKL